VFAIISTTKYQPYLSSANAVQDEAGLGRKEGIDGGRGKRPQSGAIGREISHLPTNDRSIKKET